MKAQKVTPEKYAEAAKISSVAFEAADLRIEKYGDNYASGIAEQPQFIGDEYAHCRVAAFTDDGKMAASMLCMPFNANFDGTQLTMYGIGDVSTLPQYRRQGAIKQCFKLALPDMYNSGGVFSYLYPFSLAFYRRFGYEQAARTVLWRVAVSALPGEKFDGEFKMYEPGSDITDYVTVYNSFAKNINFMLVRNKIMWQIRLTGYSPYKDNRWAFIWYDKNNAPAAFFSYSLSIQNDKRIMQVHDFCFADTNALRALLSFISTFAARYDFADIPLPAHIPLDAFVSEHCFNNVSAKVSDCGMLRVINVKRTLECAKYTGSGSFNIAVSDNYISQNNGTFCVKFGEGETQVCKTENPCDIKTDIAGFSRLISGQLDIDGAVYYNNIEILSNNETLKRAFYKKPFWINDYF